MRPPHPSQRTSSGLSSIFVVILTLALVTYCFNLYLQAQVPRPDEVGRLDEIVAYGYSGASQKTLPKADPQVQSLFNGFCNEEQLPSQATRPSQHCVLQEAVIDPAEEVNDCSPFKGGDNHLFGLKWCAWDSSVDGHISSSVLRSQVPDIEKGPMNAFLAAIQNKTKGIVIDAGAQLGLLYRDWFPCCGPLRLGRGRFL